MKKIIGTILLLLILFVTFMIYGSYGEGYRAGALTKIAKKGILFKTNEGEMYTATVINSSGEPGDADGSGVINNIWYFSIKNDPELLAMLENALLNGHRIKLHYHQKFWKLFWIGDSKYVVDGVEILKENNEQKTN
jgi:hypothetical protein